MTELTIAPPALADKAGWRRLYDGYATFYKMPMNDETAARVWSWIHDPNHVLEALVAKDGAGKLVGLAHFRAMQRPLTGGVAGFLDDLFVDPTARGAGVGKQLFAALQELGRARGWALFRWLTADDNYRARTLYDQIGKRTMWITYQMDL